MNKIRLALWAILSMWLAGVAMGQQPVECAMGGQGIAPVPDATVLKYWVGANTQKGVVTNTAAPNLSADGEYKLQALMLGHRGALNAITQWSAAEESAVVHNTLAALQSQLSATDWLIFYNFLQGLKPQVCLSKFDVELGAVAAQNRREFERSQVASAHMHPGMMQGLIMTPDYGGIYQIAGTWGGGGDDFNYPNGNFGQSTDPWWTTISGTWSISNDTAVASGESVAFHSGEGISDGCSGMFVAALPTGTYYTLATIVRGTGTSLSTFNGYMAVYLKDSAPGWHIGLRKVVNGNIGFLGSDVEAPGNVGDTAQICAYGSQISLVGDAGVIETVTDSTFTSGYLGIFANPGGTAGGAMGTWMGTNSASQMGVGIQTYVSGSSSCNTYNQQCPSNALHTPSVTNSNGTVGGTYPGPQGQANSNIEANVTVDYPASQGGTPVSVGGGVNCTLVGSIWVWPRFLVAIEVQASVWSRSEVIGGAPPSYVLGPWCVPSVTPPDYNPSTLTTNQPAIYTKNWSAACARVEVENTGQWSPWICGVPVPGIPVWLRLRYAWGYNSPIPQGAANRGGCNKWTANNPGTPLAGTPPN